MKLPVTAVLTFLLASHALPGQQLRRAVTAADVVVVAESVGVRPIGKDAMVHKLRVVESLAGDAGATLSVVEWKRVAQHQKPTPVTRKLYCLLKVDTAKAKLPSSGAPYYKMSGHVGANPALTGDNDAALILARTLLASENGTGPRETARALVQLALHGAAPVRTEAVELLAERSILRGTLDAMQTSDLASRAIGETEDIPFKIALASVCAELRVPGLVDSLCMSIAAIEDPAFARALGRIARHLHGDEAHAQLWPHVARARNATRRGNLLIAVAATSTEGALNALLQLRSEKGADPQLDAALRLHGSPRARQVLEASSKRNPDSGK